MVMKTYCCCFLEVILTHIAKQQGPFSTHPIFRSLICQMLINVFFSLTHFFCTMLAVVCLIHYVFFSLLKLKSRFGSQ